MMGDLDYGRQLRVPQYALEDYDDGPNVDIGSFGYDDDGRAHLGDKESGESTDAMFDDKGEFADVAGSVTELTNRGFKLARRIVSMGGSVSDILKGLNSLYIKPPDLRTANPTVSSYAFSNIMELLKSDGLIRTERGMPVGIKYRPPASRQVFREANPDDPTMAGLGTLGDMGQYEAYSDKELTTALIGALRQATALAAARKMIITDPAKKDELVGIATKVAVKVGGVRGAVGSVVRNAYDYASDVVMGMPIGSSVGTRRNLEYLKTETRRRTKEKGRKGNT